MWIYLGRNTQKQMDIATYRLSEWKWLRLEEEEKKKRKNACYSSRWRNSYRISAPWLKLADWASECFWWIRYTPELSSRGGQHAKTPPNIFSLHISNTSIDGRHAKYCIKTISILISRQWILKQSQNVTNLKNIKARASYNMAGRDKIFYLQRRREGQWGKIERIKSLTIGTSLEIETYTYDKKKTQSCSPLVSIQSVGNLKR